MLSANTLIVGISFYTAFFLRKISQHAGEMLTAPIPAATTSEEKATHARRCQARNEIVTLLGTCIESVLFFYLMLRRFIVVTPTTSPMVIADLQTCWTMKEVSDLQSNTIERRSFLSMATSSTRLCALPGLCRILVQRQVAERLRFVHKPDDDGFHAATAADS